MSSRDNGGRSQSRWGFIGNASLTADISVGYHMEFGFDGDGGVNTESGVTEPL